MNDVLALICTCSLMASAICLIAITYILEDIKNKLK